MKIGRKSNQNTSASPQLAVDSTSPPTNIEVKPQRDLPSWVYFLLFLFAVWSIIGLETGYWNTYSLLDDSGWISHQVETVISARSDWLPGESKECLSYTRKREWATFQDKEVGYAMPWVKCDDGPDHHMKVTFYGRKVQPEYQTIGWRCSRNEVSFLNDSSFTCYQTGGER
jgi:hypothetical protein